MCRRTSGLFLMLALLLCMQVQGQEGKLSRTVTDEWGPVAGASVVVKGTTNGTITDFDGNFTFRAHRKG
ncbi:MAG: carboxypeptidase-like regulatory domain-containing protein [Tannerellaceae bacterium]|nr:carboxypeptidase-like regulatory domain-containing protein [Tannerellaceae bacterium]